MKFGVCYFATTAGPALTDVARSVEDLGFDALFLPEHSHMPVETVVNSRGEPVPDYYGRLFDPIVALGVASAVTERLRFGTSITLLAQRDPIHFAKEIATLDRLSGGRIAFLGVGTGWSRIEMANHGLPFEQRWTAVNERMTAIRSLWSDEISAMTGEAVRFTASRQEPKPLRVPPFMLGGNPSKLERIALSEADGWIPNVWRQPRALDRLPELAKLRADAGKPPMMIVALGAGQDAASIRRYEQQGVHYCVFVVTPATTVDDFRDRLGAASRVNGRKLP